jgi:ATP-dependent DNA helicase PIF1
VSAASRLGISVKIELSNEQSALFDYIEGTDAHIFVTGRAGTGKSTLLTYLIENTDKKTLVVAPTGVAALNVGGATIHSAFGFPIGMLGDVELARHLNRRTREVLRAIDMLVIDEVSMVNADMMDAMSRMLGIARGKRAKPFGGVQVVMFGDPYQLAPVLKDEDIAVMREHYQSGWFFDAKVWRATDRAVEPAQLERYELSEIFRQHDPEFKEILNAIRDGSVTQTMLDVINKAGVREVPNEDIIRLATVNATVDQVNMSHLMAIKSPAVVFKGAFSAGDQQAFGRALPVEESLTLKVGAQVMFVKNDDSNTKRAKDGTMVRRWVNGTIGRVVEIPDARHVKVRVGGEEFDVSPTSWEKVRYEIDEEFDAESGKTKEVVVPVTLAEYKQIPLRLAWAVTVHKSQGQTYDEVVIDMGRGAFAPGQTYVALSRVRSLEGLYLSRPIAMRDVMVDGNVLRFMAEAPAPKLERLL